MHHEVAPRKAGVAPWITALHEAVAAVDRRRFELESVGKRSPRPQAQVGTRRFLGHQERARICRSHVSLESLSEPSWHTGPDGLLARKAALGVGRHLAQDGVHEADGPGADGASELDALADRCVSGDPIEKLQLVNANAQDEDDFYVRSAQIGVSLETPPQVRFRAQDTVAKLGGQTALTRPEIDSRRALAIAPPPHTRGRS